MLRLYIKCYTKFWIKREIMNGPQALNIHTVQSGRDWQSVIIERNNSAVIGDVMKTNRGTFNSALGTKARELEEVMLELLRKQWPLKDPRKKQIVFSLIFIFYLLILEKRRKRETLICCSTYLCIHWLILVRALTGDGTCNVGGSGWCSDQLNYPARTEGLFVETNFLLHSLILI